MLSSETLLNYDEQLVISQLIQKHQINKKNTNLVIKYYLHFIKIVNNIKKDRSIIKTIAQISLIFAQKSNFYTTIQGNRLPGICFSMNDILKSKSYSEIRNVTQKIKEITFKTKFKQSLLKSQIQKLVQQIQNGLQEAILFEKLSRVFYENTLQISKEAQSYKQKLINFSWYLYIDSKHNLLSKPCSFVSKKFIIISVLQNIVLNSLSYITPLILQKNSPKRYTFDSKIHKKQIISMILQILVQQAQIKKSEILYFKEINEKFNSYFDFLVQKLIIKSFSDQTFDFLCNRSLEINLRKIDRKISKQIESDEMDLRKLLYYEIQNDHKKTAIQDKIIVKQKKGQKKQMKSIEENRKYKSHRILDLDNADPQISSQSIITEQEIRFPPNLIIEPFRMSIPMLHQNSQKNQLNKFIMQSIKPYICSIQNYQPIILKFISNCFDTLNQTFANLHHPSLMNEQVLQTYQFYSYLADKVWAQDQQLFQNKKYYAIEQSDEIHQCLLLISMITVILNKFEQKVVQAYFDKLLNVMQTNYINLFYTLICIEKKQSIRPPQKMIQFIKSIINRLLNEFIWCDQGFLEEIVDVSQSYDEQCNEKQAIGCVLQRLGEYMMNLIGKFANEFKRYSFFEDQTKLSQWIQKSLKLILTLVIFETQIMYNRCFDQILLCSLYGSSKILKLNIKFHDLISVYKKIIGKNPNSLQKIIRVTLKVKNTFDQQNPFRNIIEFYNTEFIKYLNLAMQKTEEKQRIQIIKQMINYSIQLEQESENFHCIYTSPFRSNQQAILLSPRLKKFKQQNHEIKYLRQSLEKENIQQNKSINITVQENSMSRQLQIYSYIQNRKAEEDLKNGKKILINLDIIKSRDPTRIKERRISDQKEEQLCMTQKGKHPIFTEFRDTN